MHGDAGGQHLDTPHIDRIVRDHRHGDTHNDHSDSGGTVRHDDRHTDTHGDHDDHQDTPHGDRRFPVAKQ